MRDLSKTHSDYATFLPAVSGFMTELLGRCKSVPGYIPDGRVPNGFEHGFEGMNFLDKEKGYYYYNKALYSECSKLVIKAKKTAESHERFYYLFELMKWEKMLLEEEFQSGKFDRDLHPLGPRCYLTHFQPLSRS